MTTVSPLFARLLADQRESLNERFAWRRRGNAKTEPEALFTHLRETVDPLLQLVHTRFPERTPAVLTALYDASLDLLTAALLGPESKRPVMQRVWTELLPEAIELLAREPVPLVGCLCNALDQVAQQRGTNPNLWLTRMRMALTHCGSLQDVTDACLVIAWQSGMPQFREPALHSAASRMKTKLSAVSLGLPDDTRLASSLESLEQDRWFRIPANTSNSVSTLMPVARAGAFSGFGGLFSRPPTVFCAEGNLIVSVDDVVYWQIIADAYGVWFRRSKDTKFKPAALPRNVSVDADGTVRWGTLACKAPNLAKNSSVACDGVTLAITIPTSHHLFLFAPTAGAA